MIIFVGPLSKILDVPCYQIQEPKMNITREIATRKLVTSNEFIAHEEQKKLSKEASLAAKMEAKLKKQQIANERKLSKEIKEKEKLAKANLKKLPKTQKKKIDSRMKKESKSNLHCTMVRKNEFPEVLSKRARTFVTPFISQDISNSVPI